MKVHFGSQKRRKFPVKKGWDAVCVRIVTWVHLKEIKTGNTFYVFNTHFDHVGDTARLESARLIKQEIKAIAKDETGYPYRRF